jgi:hypothetical protein
LFPCRQDIAVRSRCAAIANRISSGQLGKNVIVNITPHSLVVDAEVVCDLSLRPPGPRQDQPRNLHANVARPVLARTVPASCGASFAAKLI